MLGSNRREARERCAQRVHALESLSHRQIAVAPPARLVSLAQIGEIPSRSGRVGVAHVLIVNGHVEFIESYASSGQRTVASASAAIPSSRPTKPIPSPRVALTLT